MFALAVFPHIVERRGPSCSIRVFNENARQWKTGTIQAYISHGFVKSDNETSEYDFLVSQVNGAVECVHHSGPGINLMHKD